MNYLTHLYFSNTLVENATGLIIGNTAKPNQLVEYDLNILKGIAIDTKIRSFAENHPSFQSSKNRLNSRYTFYAPILVNVFYDHFLAKSWDAYSTTNLEKFAVNIYSAMLVNYEVLPNKIKKTAVEMLEKKWITSFTNIEGAHQYLHIICNHERYPKFLDQGFFELTENYQLFKIEFENYFSDLCRFIEDEEQRFNAITDKNEFTLLSA